MKTNNNTDLRVMTVEGTMTFGELENGLRTADFACSEFAELMPFVAQCKVQVMRDGNVYITELPRRVRNRALFRDDNASLSLGQNGRYYFVFSLPEALVSELPARLTRQSEAIAQKVIEAFHL